MAALVTLIDNGSSSIVGVSDTHIEAWVLATAAWRDGVTIDVRPGKAPDVTPTKKDGKKK